MEPITGRTKIFGIFGHPISHTLSPSMHNAAFHALGLPYCYLPFEVPSDGLGPAVRAVIPLGIRGLNVTLPHKEAVIPFLDAIDEEAQTIGAVNTIEVEKGWEKGREKIRLIGHNTDGRGFLESLRESGVNPKGLRVILLGAGGAAKGVAIALARASVSEMIIMARTMERGKALVDRLTGAAGIAPAMKVSLIGMGEEGKLPGDPNRPTLLINTTPLGMKPRDPLPFPESFLDARWSVADLIYRPSDTPLLLAAKRIGANPIPGLGMLLHQGAIAFEIWTGRKAPLPVMRRALDEALQSKDENSK